MGQSARFAEQACWNGEACERCHCTASAQCFPEYVHVNENFHLKDKNFFREKFYEVNKIRIALDLLGALQTRHRIFTLGPNESKRSGSVDISSLSSSDRFDQTGDVAILSGRGLNGTFEELSHICFTN